MPKIAFLGASLTEGIYGGDYVAALRRRLPDSYTLINAGVGGNTLNRMVERLDAVLSHQPDAVFVLAGTNDAIAYSQPRTRSYYRSVQGLPEGYLEPDDYEQLFRDLLTRLQLAHVQPLVGLPPMEYNPDLIAASDLFNARSRAVAQAFSVPVCDLAAVMNPEQATQRPPLDMQIIFTIGERTRNGWKDYDAERAKGGYTYSFDGIHLTQDAAEQVADLIAPFVRRHVR